MLFVWLLIGGCFFYVVVLGLYDAARETGGDFGQVVAVLVAVCLWVGALIMDFLA